MLPHKLLPVWFCGNYPLNQNMNGTQWRTPEGSVNAVTRAVGESDVTFLDRAAAVCEFRAEWEREGERGEDNSSSSTFNVCVPSRVEPVWSCFSSSLHPPAGLQFHSLFPHRLCSFPPGVWFIKSRGERVGFLLLRLQPITRVRVSI